MIRSLLLSACLALCIANPATARNLGSYQGFTASVADNFSCGQSVEVRVDAAAGQSFEGNPAALSKLVGLVRAAMSFECPSMQKIEIYGYAGNAYVGGTLASQSTRWRLAKFDTQANPPQKPQQNTIQANVGGAQNHADSSPTSSANAKLVARAYSDQEVKDLSKEKHHSNWRPQLVNGFPYEDQHCAPKYFEHTLTNNFQVRKFYEYKNSYTVVTPNKLLYQLGYSYRVRLNKLRDDVYKTPASDGQRVTQLITEGEKIARDRNKYLGAMISDLSRQIELLRTDEFLLESLMLSSHTINLTASCIGWDVSDWIAEVFKNAGISAAQIDRISEITQKGEIKKLLQPIIVQKALHITEGNKKYFSSEIAPNLGEYALGGVKNDLAYVLGPSSQHKTFLRSFGVQADERIETERLASLHEDYFSSILKYFDAPDAAGLDMERFNSGGSALDKRDAADFEEAAYGAFARVEPLLEEKKKCVWQEDSYGNQVGSETCRIVRDPDHDSKQRASNDNVKVNMTDFERACNEGLKKSFCRCFVENYDRNFSQNEYRIFFKNPLAYALAATKYLKEYDAGVENALNTIDILLPLLDDERTRYPRVSYMNARYCRRS